MTTAPPFSLTGDLPGRRLAIEASAGTGKTYTIAGLVARFVAEQGVPIDQILVVTFTRAAAAELRDRIRLGIAQAAVALRNTSGQPPNDGLLAHLAAREPEMRLARLERAIAGFDTATITTIHGFAQQALMALGSSAPGDPDATLDDDSAELVGAVCADVLSSESARDPGTASELPRLDRLRTLSLVVLGNPGIRVLPDPDDAGTTPRAARWRRLLGAVLEEVERRRRATGRLAFEEVLTLLRDALTEDGAAIAAMRRRFSVALIDEFQDTDPVQWDIFRRIFHGAGSESRLILVGDPKQAIYSFRGANVHTYLDASRETGTRRESLDVNWRSDKAMLDALGRLLDGVTFGDPEIRFATVEATLQHRARRLRAADGSPLPALRVRAALGPELQRGSRGEIATDDAVAAIARDLAGEVQALLETARLPPGDRHLERALAPGDIAVLIGKRSEAAFFQRALRNRNIPAVVLRGDSVMRSKAAVQWRWLVGALARPGDPSRARTAAVSWFFGCSGDEIAASDDAILARVQRQLADWADVLAREGVVEFCARVRSDSGVSSRLLAGPDGERDLTDLDHIAGLLQSHPTSLQPSAAGLLATLEDLATMPEAGTDDDVTARRVESEADAVQIITAHSAKGLEFPVVCVPTLWRGSSASAMETIYQDPETRERTIDIANGEKWPTSKEAEARRSLAQQEAVGENLRLLYVALTRARHQCVVWWSRARGSNATGLARVLFARDGVGIDPVAFAAPRVTLPDDGDALAAIERVLSGAGDAAETAMIGVTRSAGRWAPDENRGRSGELELAVLPRVPPRASRRWSFSAISDEERVARLDPADPNLGDGGVADEPLEEPDQARVPSAEATTDLLLGPVPGGARFGTLVHAVLERVDFAAPDLEAELTPCVEGLLRWHPWPVASAVLVKGLRAVIESPLGPPFGGKRLRDIGRSDRLDELGFELRLGERGRHPTDRAIGRLILAHLGDGDPLRAWATRLASGVFGVELAGHLTGSIDSVIRVRDPGEEGTPGRFVIVDYKTNRLAERGRPPISSDYEPARLLPAMVAHHYPLQALIYSVALHRYLRWRVRGYDPGAHLGGVGYLFVRGMSGLAPPTADSEAPGVFSWRFPASLVIACSDLLDGREVAS